MSRAITSIEDLGKGASTHQIKGLPVVRHQLAGKHHCYASPPNESATGVQVFFEWPQEAQGIRIKKLSAGGYEVTLVNDGLGSERTYLRIRKSRKITGEPINLNSLINELIRDLRRVGGVRPTWSAVGDFLERFKRGSAHSPSEGLQKQEIVGLYGELWLLKNWFQPLLQDWSKVLGVWKGWDKGEQDFQGSGWVMEGKTSHSIEASHIWINGLKQLQTPSGNGRLLLCHLHFSSAANGPGCLGSLVDEIDKELPESLKSGFIANLQTVEYKQALAIDYDEIKFSNPSVHFYDVLKMDVRHKFPRLIKREVGDEHLDLIQDVKYKVLVEDLKNFEIKESEAKDAVLH